MRKARYLGDRVSEEVHTGLRKQIITQNQRNIKIKSLRF